jgi:hypothetical protein
MAGLARLDVSVEEAASLLHVQPSTVRRRLRAGELLGRRDRGSQTVELDPATTWIRVEDAAAILGVTPATVRALIVRGALAGRREREGRWRVRLASVLEDRRAHPDTVNRFGGEPAERPAAPVGPRLAGPGRLRRDVFIRLSAEDAELLERGRDRHGTITAAVAAGLRAIDTDDTYSPGEVAELRVDRDLHRDRADAVTRRVRVLHELVMRGVVEELYCPTCDKLVPVTEAEVAEVDGGDQVELYHAPHGHRRAGALRASSVVGRRRRLELAQP